jgi:hypothetical protein
MKRDITVLFGFVNDFAKDIPMIFSFRIHNSILSYLQQVKKG